MEFRKEQVKSKYLLDTNVENIYISEYMTMAPGDYVKVYLFALMYANLGEALDINLMAKQLMINKQIIHDAWTYWEEMGVIKKVKQGGSAEDYGIEFLNIKEKLYAKDIPTSSVEEEPAQISGKLREEELADMYVSVEKILGRPLGGSEPMEIISWVQDFAATPEMIIYTYSYCKHTLKKDNVRYVGKIIKEWMERGLDTTEKIEEYLSENDRRYALQKRIFKALGFTRNATEAEKEIMNRWFDKDGFTIDKILDACAKTSGISNPNINYIDKVLLNWKNEENETAKELGAKENTVVTMAVIKQYYDYIREKSQKEAQARREEIYDKIPEIKEIDEKIRTTGVELSKTMLSGDRSLTSKMKENIEDLMIERAIILTENNLEADYMEDKYLCSICKDTGTTDTGERCSCFEQRRNEAQEWQNSLKK